MRELFGTDGIRGKANTYPITPEIALQVGKAIAHVFKAEGHGSAKAVIGKDTRLSGYMIETALTSGIVSMGMDVFLVGPMPTPAVAHLTKSMCASCGIMITASHNPSDDNGIKIFSSDGFKLPDDIELDIETHVLGGEITSAHISTHLLGKAYRIEDARGRYIEFAKSSIKNQSLKGLKIVLDCANGAAYFLAPLIFRELGATVYPIAINPDGFNINEKCGATYTDTMKSEVLKTKADIGIALDGDADRVIFCDSKGNIINGDRIIGLCALDFARKKRLSKNTVVITTMSNLGLSDALKKNGINVEVTDVGDRYVIDRMRSLGLNLGGEQSGHLIFMDYATTGDGIISSLHVLNLMASTGKSLTELADFMTEYPQKLTNINVKEKVPFENVPGLLDIIKKCEEDLSSEGRVIVRYSGTENKIRILIEASSEKKVNEWTEKIGNTIRKGLT
ncbi:MAG TPA: phosphoglucosamine mutase [Victivallales bacterium]|nr:phosphoglucosamine mutase [Victivallales bacterium]HPO90297.1 phosphoglucosamine mutase [Victivallales bacterium]HRR28863.1 phosphoglucosamine mutase [Victivallales bacterium]HRU02369.1 phosphoglucosamine mutase [Victivallales bacterium]